MPHGNVSSPLSCAFVRYVLMSRCEMRKSVSLKSYDTFHPSLPYLRRSCATAWKNASTYVSGRYPGCGQSLSVRSVIFAYVARMFSFKPFGGSVTTFSDRCKIPSGNLSVGSVVSHKRNSFAGLVIFSKIFSSVLSHEGNRWQFWSITHSPRALPISSISAAFGPMPCPSAMYFSFAPGLYPMRSPSRNTSNAGSAPGESTNTTGVSALDMP